MKKIILAVLAAAVPIAPAQAACWTSEQVSAAKVRDLDTMLMVASLRCRHTNVAVLTSYNNYVVRHRKPLVQVNDMLRNHYASGDKKAAMTAYDNYVTKVANRYGAGAEGLSCNDMLSIVDAMAAEQPQIDALIAVAERAGVKPYIDAETCERPFAGPALTTATAVIGRK
jgi:hypothetical protein